MLSKGVLNSVLFSAYRSKMAYVNPKILNKQKKANVYLENLSWGPVFVTSPKHTNMDAQGYMWSKDDTVYITFRGTSSPKDAFADIDVRTVIYNDVCIHKGFFDQFMSIEPQITDKLSKASESTFVFAGHSLGGGLSQIAAPYYGKLFPAKKIVCHTFGAPRTGDIRFSRWFNTHVHEHVRVSNKNDPVPMIPIRPVWHHTFNTCLIIDDDCKTSITSKEDSWYWRVIKSFYNIDYDGLIKDHDCDIYIKRLEQLCKE